MPTDRPLRARWTQPSVVAVSHYLFGARAIRTPIIYSLRLGAMASRPHAAIAVLCALAPGGPSQSEQTLPSRHVSASEEDANGDGFRGTAADEPMNRLVSQPRGVGEEAIALPCVA
jgi:hypothetical protein